MRIVVEPHRPVNPETARACSAPAIPCALSFAIEFGGEAIVNWVFGLAGPKRETQSDANNVNPLDMSLLCF